ncbi:MAG: hypothetical protein F6J94_17560 [Moorea sp. SIO1F2]|uniref:hypothetical protein n=1 Tax=Moorena sp. SIO1F2 TaxID=2607819 RepID=UPI0013BBC00D|nr:hypothetical protein [Moorena sp. SIO1F2]NET83658.1 hypothetical protein [Moorena sp. SIO1F2]
MGAEAVGHATRMEQNHLRTVRFFKMTLNSISNHRCQLIQGICLSKDRFSQSPGGITLVRIFLNQKHNLAHVDHIIIFYSHYAMKRWAVRLAFPIPDSQFPTPDSRF